MGHRFFNYRGHNPFTGVFIDGAFSGRNDGIVLDFDNGRALISGDTTDSAVTGEFAVKDFNVSTSPMTLRMI